VLLSLVDSLRCPAGHQEAALVLSAESWNGARVATGLLGCPTCHARYPIRDGVVDFTGGQAGPRPPDESLETGPTRLAAQLGLAEPGGVVLLTGRYASLADGLVALVDVTCVAIDAVSHVSPAAIAFRLLDALPLRDAALRAAAIDDPRTTPALLAEVMRCVKERGRLVAPSHAPLPVGVRMVARDEREWVGDVEAAHPVIPLRRGSR
jgi:uncharacterized protein YbaR (Trm112 family)